MGIVGNLKTMELSELLQWLARSRKSGILVLSGPQAEKRLYLEDGKIISVASTDPTEWLGHFLVSHGFIDEEALAVAMGMQEENRMLLGKILVTIGALDNDSLAQMLRLKAEISIFDLFTWTEAEFRFLDGELPEFKMVPLSLDVTALVLEGARRLDEWNRIREAIPSLQAVPVAVAPLQADEEDRATQSILNTVDDDRTVEDIVLHTHSSEYLVCQVLLKAAQRGHLKLVRARFVGRSDEDETGASIDPLYLLERGEEHLAACRFEPALRHLRAAHSLEPDNRKIQEKIQKAETSIFGWLESKGIVPKAVPHLARTLDELPSLGISPQEAFILTRINDEYDIETIQKISPMPSLDAQLVFWRLLEAEHILLLPAE